MENDAPNRLFVKGVGHSFFSRCICHVQDLSGQTITVQQLITCLFLLLLFYVCFSTLRRNVVFNVDLFSL